MILSPKADFIASRQAKDHVELVASKAFQHTLTLALAEMLYQENAGLEPVATTAAWHRMMGARNFIHILLNLAEPPPQRKIEPRQNILYPKH